MNKWIGEDTDCNLLAAYGTLRDDDNTGLSWTRDFIKVFIYFSTEEGLLFLYSFEDIESATTGKVLGFRLYFNPSTKYGLGIFTGNSIRI